MYANDNQIGYSEIPVKYKQDSDGYLVQYGESEFNFNDTRANLYSNLPECSAYFSIYLRPLGGMDNNISLDPVYTKKKITYITYEKGGDEKFFTDKFVYLTSNNMILTENGLPSTGYGFIPSTIESMGEFITFFTLLDTYNTIKIYYFVDARETYSEVNTHFFSLIHFFHFLKVYNPVQKRSK